MKVFLFLAALLACFAGSMAQSNCTYSSLREIYYNDRYFLPPIIHQTTGFPNYNWGTVAPFTGGPADYYCIRWDGTITFPTAGTYTFQTYVDDGIRIYVNNTLVVTRFSVGNANSAITGTPTYFNAGPATFLAEYFEYNGGASVRTLWKAPGSSVYVDIPTSVYSSSNCTVKTMNVSTPVYNGVNDTTSFNVKLSDAPISDVVLSVSSSCLIFPNCTYTITTTSWTSNLTITGYHNPDSTSDCCTVTVTAIEGDPDYYSQTKTVQSCSSTTFKTAHSYGDPHMLTFDGLVHDNFKIGDFYMTRQTNGEFAIQQRQEACGAAACNLHVAVKYQGTVFYMYTDLVSGAPNTQLSGDAPSVTGVTITSVNDVYTFSTPTGIVATVAVGKWNGREIFYLNVDVRAGSGFQGKLVGLTGYYDGNVANDMMMPNGTVASTLSQFQESWRVTSDSQNLFKTPSASIPTLLGASSAKTLPFNPVKCNTNTTGDVSGSIKNATDSPLKNTTTPTGSDTTFDCTVWTNATVHAAAIASCSPYFNNSVAQCCSALGVSGNPYYQSCLCDYNVAQGPDFTQDSVNAFLSACASAAQNANTTCNSCPSNCNGQGTCNSGVCACNPGYNGTACQQNWNQPPEVTGSTTLVLSRSCAPSTITVGGQYFYAPNLRCNFGTLGNTTATWVSNFQVTCPLPTIPLGTTTLTVRIIRAGVISTSSASISVATTCCDAPCKNGGTCSSVSADPYYSCSCVAPYVGSTCATTCDLVATPVVSFSTSEVNKTAVFVLNAKPNSTITVSLASGCMLVSKCSLTFTPENWNVPQTVTLTRNPSSTATTCTLIGTASGNGTCSNTNSTTLITKTDSKFALAYSYGDPHMLTFDGYKYDNFVLGDYVLTRTLTGEFVVQARQDKCAVASCNYAVVVKYYDVYFYVFLTTAGVPSTQLIGDPATVGATITIDGSVYNFDTPNGMRTAISVQWWLFRNVPTYHLTVNFKAGESLKGHLAGLLGNYDGNAANDFITPAGAVVTDKSAFIASWAVPSSENLLLDHTKTISAIWNATVPTYTASPAANCAAPATSPSNATDSPLKNTTTPDDPTYVVPDCTVWPNETVRLAAIASCSPSFNNSVAQCCSSNGVSGEDFYETCLCDYNLLGGSGFTQTSVNNFLTQCQGVLSQNNVTCDVCPSGCSGQGTCSSGVCTCNPGYNATDCSENWNDAPAPAGITPTSAGFSCSLVATISGANFFGTNLQCSFNGVVVAATKVSNFELTCAVPTTFASGTTSVQVKVIRSGVISTASVTLTFYDSCCSNPCKNNGTCQGALNDPAFTCVCPSPYSGSTCETVGQCSAGTQYGGTIGPVNPLATGTLECPPGQTLKVQATCGSGQTYTNWTIACTAITGTCAAETFENAAFATGYPGLPTLGTCVSGYSGAPWRNCKEGGVWGTDLSSTCTRNSCPAVTEGNVEWPSTPSSTPVNLACPAGFVGTPSRVCGADGTWGSISQGCLTAASCPAALAYAHADFAATSENVTAVGVCNAGWVGTPTRYCKPNGVWESLVKNVCTRTYCSALTDSVAKFAVTFSADYRIGTCLNGKSGSPVRLCNLDATWGPMTGACK